MPDSEMGAFGRMAATCLRVRAALPPHMQDVFIEVEEAALKHAITHQAATEGEIDSDNLVFLEEYSRKVRA